MNIFEEATGTSRKASKSKATKSTGKVTKAKSTSTKPKGTKPKKCNGGHNDAGRTVTDTMMPMMGLGLGMMMMDGLFD